MSRGHVIARRLALALLLLLAPAAHAGVTATPKVGLSGQTLAVVFTQADGSPSYGNAASLAGPTVASAPAAWKNGVPLALGTPISYADYLLYPLPVTIGASDNLTVSAPAAWASTGDGAAAAIPDVAAAAPASFLPPFAATPKSLGLGWNLQAPDSAFLVPVYANLFSHATWAAGFATTPTFDGNGNCTALAGGGTCSVSAVLGAAGANGYQLPGSSAVSGYPGLRDGTYTLLWTGGTGATLALTAADGVSAVTPLASAPGAQTYAVAAAASQFWVGLRVTVAQPAGACDVRNVRLFGPGTATDGSQFWHPDLLTKLQGGPVIRFMDATRTNSSNRVDYADATPVSAVSRAGSTATHAITLSTVTTFDNADHAFSSGIFAPSALLLFATSGAHGLAEGQTVQLSGDALSTLNWTDGVSARAAGLGGQVHVVSGTTFAMPIYSPAATLLGTQSLAGVTGTMTVGYSMPVAECCQLGNAAGADVWLNVPHAATDAYVTAMAADVLAHLGAGRKCYLEYSNETWNLSLAFQQSAYVEVQASLQGLPDGAAFTAKRFKEVLAVFASAFATAGRSGDLVGVLGCFANGVGRTTEMVAWLAANGGTVPAVAVAPYYSGTPQFGPLGEDRTAILAAMTAAQHEDLEELNITRHPWYVSQPGMHLAAARASFPQAKALVYEFNYAQPVMAGASYDAKCRAITRRPRAVNMLLNQCQQLQDQGYSAACLYNLAGPVGSDGANLFSQSFCGYFGAATLPGAGDGSDGLNDNRVNPENLLTDVSVVGFAARRWSALGPVAPSSGGGVKSRRTEGGRVGSRGSNNE